MFLGHYAVGLAAKNAAPKLSLGTLFLAAQFLDLLWPAFLLMGLEQVRIDPGNTRVTPLDFVSYPFSHSLLAAIIWAAVVAAAYFVWRRYARGAVWLGVAVFSHWALDALMHRPDLPLFPGSGVMVGLGLWNSVAGTILLEGLLFAAGVFLYLRGTRAKDKVGVYGCYALIALLALIYGANILGPPPPSEQAIAFAALLQWLLILFGYWVDRHREFKGRVA